MPQAGMQIAVEQGALLSMLVKLLDARRILEIGTFTGYSSTAMALALPPDGRIVCCDISEEFTTVARRTWAAAGSSRVDLRLAPALETLRVAAGHGRTGVVRPRLHRRRQGQLPRLRRGALLLVREGGLIAIDNVLGDG